MTRRRGTLPKYDWDGVDVVGEAGSPPITPVQCRMARAGIAMSVRELARLSEVSGLTVTRFENGNIDCPVDIVGRFKYVLEKHGARFFADGDRVGVMTSD